MSVAGPRDAASLALAPAHWDAALVPEPWRVVKARREMRDTVTLDLVPVAGPVPEAWPAWAPGQFNMLYAFGVGEIPISLSGDQGTRDTLVHTLRGVGAVSRALVALKPGAIVGLRGPFGTGWPVGESQAAEGNDVVVIAGGLGLAPLRPAIYRLLARREHYGRIVLLYGARTPGDILFRRELEHWRRRLDLDVMVTVDHAGDGWHGDVGVVPALLPRAAFDPQACTALVCGPEIMMRFALRGLAERGVAAESTYLSMERNMKCAIGLCGHCQFGPTFVCKDGPVFRLDRVAHLLSVPEI